MNVSPSVLFDSATLWTVAHQAPLSMGFSRQEYWSGLPFPSPGDLPDPEIEPGSPTLQADSLLSETPGKPPDHSYIHVYLLFFLRSFSHIGHYRLFSGIPCTIQQVLISELLIFYV